MVDEDSDRSKIGYTMKFRWFFGIWTFSLVVWHLKIFVHCLTFEQVLALSLQEWCWRILHYWISNARISVLGTTVRLWAVCTAQTFFSCSLGILSSIRIVGTAGMHNFDRSFKSSGIFSQSDLPQGAEIPQGGRALGCARTCRRARVCARVAVPAWQYVGAAPQVCSRAAPLPSPFIDFVCNFCVGGIRARKPEYRKVLAGARSGVRWRADVRACARAWPCLRDSM
jgi:hypothetical protein